MQGRVAILGGGHGVANVIRALREEQFDLTAIVTVADDGGSSGELRRRWGGPAVGDVRRTLSALAGDGSALDHAFAQRLTINRLGTHPLGNLVLGSLTAGFGDIGSASDWLCTRLSLRGRVLPASKAPVRLVGETDEEPVRGESAISATRPPITRLRFEPSNPEAPAAALRAIDEAEWLLLAPGSLFTSTLATAALPDIAAGLRHTHALVLWICNLAPERFETAGMTAADHLTALRGHGVRLDAVLYDPSAELHLTGEDLAGKSLMAIPRHLESSIPGTHDPDLLREALEETFRATHVPVAR